MSRATTLLLALVLALPALALTGTQDTEARTRHSRDVTRITLRVPIQVLGDASDLAPRPAPDDSGDEVEPAAWFDAEAEAFWNQALARHAYKDCYTFVLNVSFKPITSDADRKPGHHLVRFEPGHAPDAPFLAEHGDPYKQDLEATWGWVPIGAQLGHLLGIGQAVANVDAATVERLGQVAEERIGPLPDCVDAMAEGSYTIYARYTVDTTAIFEEAGTGQIAHLVVEIWAALDETGTLAGEATAAYDEIGWAPSCTYTAKGNAGGFPVTGRRDGDRVELEVTGQLQAKQSLTCAPFNAEYAVPFASGNAPLVLAGDLVDDRFEEESTESYGLTVETTVRTLILERVAVSPEWL